MAGKDGRREKRQVGELDFLPNSPGEDVPVEVEELPQVHMHSLLVT